MQILKNSSRESGDAGKLQDGQTRVVIGRENLLPQKKRRKNMSQIALDGEKPCRIRPLSQTTCFLTEAQQAPPKAGRKSHLPLLS